MGEMVLTALEYLKSLIDGQAISNTPVQASELVTLLRILETEQHALLNAAYDEGYARAIKMVAEGE